LANGVSRFWRLLPAQVNDAPEALTSEPNFGFARTFTHGAGVSTSCRKTIAYSRPLEVKPPN
jgi:hypothetical protein